MRNPHHFRQLPIVVIPAKAGIQGWALTTLIVCSTFAWGAYAQDAPPVSVEASVDRTEITIGDQVRYQLTIEGQKGVDFQKPGWGEGLQGFQILDFEQGKKEQTGDRWKVTDTYILSTFTPEDYVIPPISVPVTLPSGATEVLQTQPINIKVASVLPEDEEAVLEIKDIKEPVPVYSGILTGRILAIAGGILLLVLLAYWLWRRSKRGEEFVKATPSRPEHEVAFEKLADLRELVAGWGETPDQIQCKQFGLELSEILREYLENRYGFIALEMTTYEIGQILPAILKSTLHRARMNEGESPFHLTLRILEETDLLKFAKFRFPAEKLRTLMDDCENLVETTRRPEREPETPEFGNIVEEAEAA
jgi:hypothetical protein